MNNDENPAANTTPGPDQMAGAQMDQPIPPQQMSQSVPEQPASLQSTNSQPNQIPGQPIAQQTSQSTPEQTPMSQPLNPQPFPGQPLAPQPISEPIQTTSNKGPKAKKKLGLIIGCSVGAVALAALVVTLCVIFLGNKEKTVTCVGNITRMGMNISGETSIKVKDGEISSGNVSMNIDLKAMEETYKKQEKELIDMLTDSYKSNCQDHCTFNYDYKEGDSVKYTMQYDKDGVSQLVWSYGEEGMSAQEIADKVQKALEDSNTTCKQK